MIGNIITKALGGLIITATVYIVTTLSFAGLSLLQLTRCNNNLECAISVNKRINLCKNNLEPGTYNLQEMIDEANAYEAKGIKASRQSDKNWEIYEFLSKPFSK